MIGAILAVVFCAVLWAIVLVLKLSWLIAAIGTLLVVGGVTSVWLYRRWRARRASREIERSLARQADQFASRARPDQQPEIAALTSEFQRAIAAIRGSKLGKGGSGALYALPWYVIIGPPGAGKSTSIRNSGLNFPFQTSRGAVRGVGGTRNCDWWLANEAVILDTAGRYATEDDDNDEWLAFLDMLKRTRARRPINGVMVAVSVEVLLRGDASELEDTARKLRARLDEVMGRLGLVLPVYLMFTKCDLLPGFVETFCEFKRSEREQVWGFTLPVDARGESLLELIAKRFERLSQVLERRVVARLPEARHVEHRERIYALPEEFESLGEPLAQLCERLFADNVYQDAPIVRGVYFTSGTQEGSAVGRAVSAMAAAFGLAGERTAASTPPAEPKSYFLGELFSQVIFPDAHLAGESAGARRRRRWLELGSAATLTVAAICLAALPAMAYVNNRQLLADVETAIRKVVQAPARPADKGLPLTALDPLRAVVLKLVSHEREGVPPSYGMGLYQGDKLLPGVQRFYTATVRERIIGPLVQQTAAELESFADTQESLQQRPSVEQHAQIYELLKTYLLLTKPKAPGEPALSADMREWVVERLIRRASTQPSERGAQQDALRVNVDAYVDLLVHDGSLAFSRDERTVKRARALMRRIPAVQLAVDRVVASLDPLGWDLGLDQMLGSVGLPLTGAGRVRGAFTRRAWEEHLRGLFDKVPDELLGESWVLEGSTAPQDEGAREARRCQLRSEYFARYIDSWKQFLGNLRMEEPRDSARAIAVLQDLTRGEPPPLERLARQVAYHARLEELDPKAPSDAAKAAEDAGLLDDLTRMLRGRAAAVFGSTTNACLQKDYLTNASVREALHGFYAFGVPDEPAGGAAGAPAQGQHTAVQIYQEQLAFMRDAMLASAGATDTAMPRITGANERVTSLINLQEVGWRPRFDSLLWPPINGASRSFSIGIADGKARQWCTSVTLEFDRTLRGRYPFSKSGQEASLADVAAFYRPGSGIVWAAYAGTLSSDVSRTGDRYELKLGSGVASMYTPPLTEFLNRSQAITTALFPAAADKPTVAFEVRIRPSPGIASIILTIDGQVVDFHNGPERWVPIRWPGDAKTHGAHMRVRGAGVDEVIAQEGEWGLFRLLDSGNVIATPNERFFSARFRLRTQNDVTVDIRPARAENPLVGRSGRALEVFRASGVEAPRNIIPGGKACSP